VGSRLKPTFEKFCPYPQKFGREKPQICESHCQSEVHYFEMVQHNIIDKRIEDVSSTINALKDGAKLRGITHGILMQLREKADKIRKFDM